MLHFNVSSVFYFETFLQIFIFLPCNISSNRLNSYEMFDNGDTVVFDNRFSCTLL